MTPTAQMPGSFAPHVESFSPSEDTSLCAIFKTARAVCAKLQAHGHVACFVGGTVRDFFLIPEALPVDIDIATSASPEEVQLAFPGSGFVGKAFGVCLVKRGGFQFEVATFRKEGTYSDRRHPDSVSRGTLEEDSGRRDFTVNALYFDPCKNEVWDLHGGLNDLAAKKLRCVGDATARLHEDPLRIVRLFRFMANTGLAIDSLTWQAAHSEAAGLALLSRERIVLEILKVKAGCFEGFLQGLLGCVPLSHFIGAENEGQRAPTDTLNNGISKWPARVHLQAPVSAFAVGALVATCGEKKLRDSDLQQAFVDFGQWPTTGGDLQILESLSRLSSVSTKVANYLANYVADYVAENAFIPEDSTHNVTLQTALESYLSYRLLLPLRAIGVDEFHGILTLLCQRGIEWPTPLSEVLGQGGMTSNQQSLHQYLKERVRGEARPVAQTAFEAAILERGLSKNYLGVFLGLQDAHLFFWSEGALKACEPLIATLRAADFASLTLWAHACLELKKRKGAHSTSK